MTVASATQLITALQKDRLTQSSIVIAAGLRDRRTLGCANILMLCYSHTTPVISMMTVAIVALLISRHNARFVYDLLRNLGSCRRTVATFTRTRRGFLSFLVRSRAEEDGRHSCFGVLAATIPLFIVGQQALNSAVMRLSCCTAAGYRTIAGAICRYLPVVRLVCCTAAGYHAGENVDRLQPVPHRIFHPPCQLWLVATKTAPSARHRCGYRYCRKA